MTTGDSKPLGGLRILLAEDEPMLLLDTHNVLTEAGAEIVGPVTSVQSALLLAMSEQVDCGVLDVKLKDGDIDPVAELLYQQEKGLIFVTGAADSKLYHNWPLAIILPKPTMEKTLIQAVMIACSTPTLS
jgi:DNA-binding NarL/FixJ family response regulator